MAIMGILLATSPNYSELYYHGLPVIIGYLSKSAYDHYRHYSVSFIRCKPAVSKTYVCIL